MLLRLLGGGGGGVISSERGGTYSVSHSASIDALLSASQGAFRGGVPDSRWRYVFYTHSA